jgi:hypothetical protein
MDEGTKLAASVRRGNYILDFLLGDSLCVAPHSDHLRVIPASSASDSDNEWMSRDR